MKCTLLTLFELTMDKTAMRLSQTDLMVRDVESQR
jgi:hypothetical protein